jgi:hypothetical protein
MAWNQMTARLLARSEGRYADPELTRLFDELSTEMNKPLPDRKVVAEKASAIRGRLDAMVGKLDAAKLDPAEVRRLMKLIAADGAAKPEVRWFTGSQVTSALSSLNKALGDLDPQARRPEFDAALRKLQKTYPPPVDGSWLGQPGPKPLAPLLKPLLDSLK